VESAAQYWQRFENTWHWRKSQFDRGLVEVTVADTELTAESTPGDDCLPLPDASDAFNDYSVLTGWRV
jgi:ATP-dependent helicase/nuclease subunit B